MCRSSIVCVALLPNVSLTRFEDCAVVRIHWLETCREAEGLSGRRGSLNNEVVLWTIIHIFKFLHIAHNQINDHEWYVTPVCCFTNPLWPMVLFCQCSCIVFSGSNTSSGGNHSPIYVAFDVSL